MSNLDGENSYIYNKTLSGLDSLGDTEIGDLTVNGTLTVVGLSSFESDIEMNTNFIHGLADGLLPQDAATVNQITGIAGFLKIDGTNAMTATMDVGTNQISNVVDGTLAQDAVTVNQLTTAGGAFLKLDGSTTMGGDIAVGANQITGLADGTLATDGATYGQTILRDGTNTMLGTFDLNANNITNGLDITADSVKITGASTLGVGSVAFNGLSYTYPALAPSSVGQVLQNTTTISPYTLAWTTPATPVVAVDSGTGQTNLAIMGTAPILSGAVGVVQPLYAGTIAVPSARINMDTGNISTTGNLGATNLSLTGIIRTFNPTTGLAVITSLPQYWRTAYNFTVKQQTGQTSGSTNWFALPNPVGALFSNGSASTIGYECTRTLTEFDALNPIVGTEGGGVGGCFIIPENGRVVKVSMIKPLASSSIQLALRQGSVPMTNAALSDVATYSGSAGGNTEITFGAPTANLIGGNFWCIKILVDNFTHAAGADCYNFCVVMEFEYT